MADQSDPWGDPDRPRSVNELLAHRYPEIERERREPIPIGGALDEGGPLAIAATPGLEDPAVLLSVGIWLENALISQGSPHAVRLRTGREGGLRGLSGVERLIALRLLEEGHEIRLCPLKTHLADRNWMLLIGARALLTLEPVGAADTELADLRRMAETLGVPVLRRIVPPGESR